MSPFPIRRAHRAIARLAQRYGFTLRRTTSSGHQQWKHPSGVLVVTSRGLGDHRVLKNAEHDFRRALQE